MQKKKENAFMKQRKSKISLISAALTLAAGALCLFLAAGCSEELRRRSLPHASRERDAGKFNRSFCRSFLLSNYGVNRFGFHPSFGGDSRSNADSDSCPDADACAAHRGAPYAKSCFGRADYASR